MNKKLAIRIAIIVLFIIFLIGVFIIKNQNADNVQELKKIKVNEVTRSVFYAPQYVAINNGYFKENGIDIELTTRRGSRYSNDRST